MERQIRLEDIIGAAVATLRNSLYHRMPGGVLSYDPSTQTATIQPLLNDVRLDVDTGAIVFEPWQPIQGVPVAWPRMGGLVIAGFLEQNDQVILEAFDLDPTPWRAQGRSTKPVNPVDPLRHAGAYWSALPTDLTGPITDSDVTGGASLVLGIAGGSTLVFKGTSIQLGAKATSITIGAAATSVEIGATPAALAAGPSTFAILTALGAFCTAIGAALTAAEPPVTPWELIMAPALTTAVNTLTGIVNPLLPKVQTTTVKAGP